MDDNGISVVTQEKNNQVEDEAKIDAGMQKISWLGMEMLLCQMTPYILEIGWIFSNILSRSLLSHSHKWWILMFLNISKASVSDHLPFFQFVIHSTPAGRTRENRQFHFPIIKAHLKASTQPEFHIWDLTGHLFRDPENISFPCPFWTVFKGLYSSW